MKKKICMAISLLLAVVIFSGCSSQVIKITAYSDLNEKIVAQPASPIPAQNFKAAVEERYTIALKDFKFFDTSSSAVAALKSGQVDAVMLPDFSAEFFEKQNSDLLAIFPPITETKNTVHFSYLGDKAEFGAALDAAIDELTADGTLDALKKKYTTDLKDPSSIAGAEIPKIDGAATIIVGVSGDIPPIDYIAANGKSVGYSIEVLTLLSKKLNVNFEIKQISNEAKFTALVSGKVDLIFFQVLNKNLDSENTIKSVFPNVVFSKPYLIFDRAAMLVKK